MAACGAEVPRLAKGEFAALTQRGESIADIGAIAPEWQQLSRFCC
jgi:hypothetical protein